ncbi:hypothetical protein [Pendulispora albinea]|uniref:LamG domain-containing protein n=1 Tax=Pendulispora albinea TaxID=2741071 RepID=A0ABZ2LTY9_9BACT
MTPPDARPPWTPAMLHPAFWLDGDNTVLSDGTVSEWTDTSGNKNHATQTTVALRPRVIAFSGGHQAIAFNGTTRLNVLDSASLRWNRDDFAVFAVLRYSGIVDPGNFAGTIYARVAAPEPSPGVHLLVTATPGSGFMVGTARNVRITSADAGYEGYKPHVVMFRRTGSRLDLRVDGVAAGSLSVAPDDVSARDENGFIGGSSGTAYINGDIASLLGIHATVTDAGASQIEAYMRTRYGF